MIMMIPRLATRSLFQYRKLPFRTSSYPTTAAATTTSSYSSTSLVLHNPHNLPHQHPPEPLPYSDVTDVLVAEHNHNGDDGVLTLTLNRPKQHHALNSTLLESLQEQLEKAAQDPQSIRAIVIQSHGNVFSSGHDLVELQDRYNENGRESLESLFELSSNVMQRLSTLPQPTIAAVQGLATAAGCQLAASCTLVVASPRSSFATPGASTIGLACHTPAVALSSSHNHCHIPPKILADMILTGRLLTSTEAIQYGLVSRIVGNPYKEAAKLAHQLANKQSTVATQMGKHTLDHVLSSESEATKKNVYEKANAAMVENLLTKDAQYGIDCFRNKTKPKWSS